METGGLTPVSRTDREGNLMKRLASLFGGLLLAMAALVSTSVAPVAGAPHEYGA